MLLLTTTIFQFNQENLAIDSNHHHIRKNQKSSPLRRQPPYRRWIYTLAILGFVFFFLHVMMSLMTFHPDSQVIGNVLVFTLIVLAVACFCMCAVLHKVFQNDGGDS